MSHKYNVVYVNKSAEKRFEKFLRTVKKEMRDQILDAVLGLGQDPRPYKTLKINPPISLYEFMAHYRLRIGHYRVLYDVDDHQRKIYLLDIRKRNERTYN